MLETDDVDEDYFTPVATTSLANIFGTSSKKQETKDNETLKYTPPKPQNTSEKQDDSKVTQCKFATALVGYEWVDDAYISRGKLGLAILKISKTGLHNIILYDSKKTTLSSTTINPTFEITINNKSLSYYDDQRKYWLLYVNENCIKPITEILTSLDVLIKNTDQSHAEHNSPKPSIEEKKANTEEISKNNVGSDTDSSINKKTKMSILNRMANVGHSVLPTNTNVNEQSSDSSDISENIAPAKTLRHKPVKNVVKKLNMDKNTALCSPQKIFESEPNQVALNTDKVSDKHALYTYVNGILVPVTSTNLISNTVDRNINNMDLFINEQRMNNTEMRINVNRITEKVDHVLQKLNKLEDKDINNGSSLNIHTSVYQKLLEEYEKKIKTYEDLLKAKDEDTKFNTKEKDEAHVEIERNVEELKTTIIELEKQNQEKENEISRLNDESNLMQQRIASHANEEIDMSNKLKNMEVELSSKDSQLEDIKKNYEGLMQTKNEKDIQEKIKYIMNSTYQTLAGNFDNNESYSGEAIKKVIGVVIKKITLNSLNMLNNNTS